MDFASRSTRPAGMEQPATAGHAAVSKGSKLGGSKFNRVSSVVLLFTVTALLIVLIVSFVFGGKNTESSYIKKGKYQAVFLNGGQVYFGKVGAFNGSYMTLSDIYYLRVNQQVQPGQTQATNDVSLAKLGNELHGPEDTMVINRSEVQFWENLKDDGQVVKAITEYKKNPTAANSQTNSNAANGSATQSSGNNQQSNTTPTNNTSNTPATNNTTPTTKKQ